MRLAAKAACTLLAAAMPMAASGAVPSAQARQPDAPLAVVSVELSREAVSAEPGEKISFESTVRNTGDRPLSGLIAHLNILSSDPGVYVDPEDWSARRTLFLDDLPAGQATRLRWEVQAVTAGPMILFVAVTRPRTRDVAVSGQLQLAVGGQRVVNAGGVLPLVAGVPAAVLLLLGLTRVRRRRIG